ncbi:5141_t:CDS:1 [Dentiscutata erythropus]|uniref:5141_t:CDS:1 n=1 Tax=Dentiscutata erythropus TaxID=1348616 RepID=A0A9N9CIT2_9GLOM|nr:5141_t:CDS:1 [Dentiscutata erythropus]
MISSNTSLFSKQSFIYYREKHNSLSLPSPPPSPHGSALRGSKQNEMANTLFPPIKYLLDIPTDHSDNIKKTELSYKKTPSHCLSRFSLSNIKSSPLKTSHTIPELIIDNNTSSYYTNHDKNNVNVYKISVNQQQNSFKNPYTQASTVSSFIITFKKIDDPINSPKFSFMQSQTALEPESYEFLPKKDTKFKIQRLMSTKRQRHSRSNQTKRLDTSVPQRKRKGNSLVRVMADQGLLESVFNTDITSNDTKSVRIPPPLPMQIDELMSNINALNLDNDALEKITPAISWKGQPLSITHLPHYNALHPIEAHVVSILRLTPIQYLTGKHTLISAAHRYAQKALPFKKSDAQKLLRIDVNKASKLWEFFHQAQWI